MIMITLDFILIYKKKKKKVRQSHTMKSSTQWTPYEGKKKKQVVLKFSSLSIAYVVEN